MTNDAFYRNYYYSVYVPKEYGYSPDSLNSHDYNLYEDYLEAIAENARECYEDEWPLCDEE